MVQNIDESTLGPILHSDSSQLEQTTSNGCSARIAIYDSLKAAPRIVNIEYLPIREFIDTLTIQTYTLAQQAGGQIPFTVIQEVVENFIHAKFKEPVVSILDHGNTISFADQGPGIQEKEKAQLPGFTSATGEMKKYIRGVGSGLPTVREFLSYSGGTLSIEDNVRDGAVVTITLTKGSVSLPQQQTTTSPKQETPAKFEQTSLSQKKMLKREEDVLRLFLKYDLLGPSDLNAQLGLSLGTASRTLTSLEDAGLITCNGSKKRSLTDDGKYYLENH